MIKSSSFRIGRKESLKINNAIIRAKKIRAKKIIHSLSKQYSKSKISLNYSNSLELLIAVMLSAQCTDKMVNKVTETLFKKYKTVKDFAQADISILEQDIKSTGFYRNKAANIKKTCQLLIKEFGGNVPHTMDEILKLHGVARKTANIVLGNAFGIIEGIAVDTHVRRLSQRLGLTKNQNPIKIEQDLMQIIPKELWLDITYFIIEHGRKVCKAPIPICSKCKLIKMCPKIGVTKFK